MAQVTELDLHKSYKDMVLNAIKDRNLKRGKFGEELQSNQYSVKSYRPSGCYSAHFDRFTVILPTNEWLLIKLSIDTIDFTRRAPLRNR